MGVQLNHTIVWCSDKERSARFLVAILGLPSPVPFGQMLVVQLDNGVSLDFFERDGAISIEHLSFWLCLQLLFANRHAKLGEENLDELSGYGLDDGFLGVELPT